MNWRKLGLIFRPTPDIMGAVSHAQVPTPILLDDSMLRVYYSSRDGNGISRPYFFDVDSHNPLKVVGYGKTPCMDAGIPGCFDDNGVMPCSVIKLEDDSFRMYYVGFELYQKVRYKLFSGVAISQDGERFVRYSQTPVLDRADRELMFRSGPYVSIRDGEFHMYYVAGSEWETINNKSMPRYEIKFLASPDGLHWPEEGHLVLPITEDDEHGFGRPWIVRTDSGYEMFYSVRRRSLAAYRMGWATSNDGLHWTRRDNELGLDVTPGSFDDKAIMYAAVVTMHGKTYCFYNGNDFGADGIAVAVKEEPE